MIDLLIATGALAIIESWEPTLLEEEYRARLLQLAAIGTAWNMLAEPLPMHELALMVQSSIPYFSDVDSKEIVAFWKEMSRRNDVLPTARDNLGYEARLAVVTMLFGALKEAAISNPPTIMGQIAATLNIRKHDYLGLRSGLVR